MINEETYESFIFNKYPYHITYENQIYVHEWLKLTFGHEFENWRYYQNMVLFKKKEDYVYFKLVYYHE